MDLNDLVFKSMEKRDLAMIRFTKETTNNIVLLSEEIESLLIRMTELEKRVEELESNHD